MVMERKPERKEPGTQRGGFQTPQKFDRAHRPEPGGCNDPRSTASGWIHLSILLLYYILVEQLVHCLGIIHELILSQGYDYRPTEKLKSHV